MNGAGVTNINHVELYYKPSLHGNITETIDAGIVYIHLFLSYHHYLQDDHLQIFSMPSSAFDSQELDLVILTLIGQT